MDVEPAPAVAVTLGRCDEMRAEVFLRLSNEPAGHDAACAVSGTLTGPQRGRDTTLPTTSRLTSTTTPGVARAILTEPAYWTPDLPNLYRLRATVAAPGATPHAIDHLVGLRRLGIRGRSLWLDGRRWVPRGRRGDDVADLAACKTAALAAVVTDPSPSLLARADEIGVAVLALCSETETNPATIAARIAAWSTHPSVMLAILPANMSSGTAADIATLALPHRGTLLLAATIRGIEPRPPTTPTGIDALVVTLDEGTTPHESWREGTLIPLLAWRREATTPSDSRGPCDRLQASLATWATIKDRDTRPWDWAGYIVG